MRFVGSILFLPLLFIGQDDAEKLRSEKLNALEDWSGHWKVTLSILEPAELKGSFEGELDVKWDKPHTTLLFDGTLPARELGNPSLQIGGRVTFNHLGQDLGYRAVFGWSADARLALAKSSDGRRWSAEIDSNKDRFVVASSGKEAKSITIGLPSGGKDKVVQLLKVELRR